MRGARRRQQRQRRQQERRRGERAGLRGASASNRCAKPKRCRATPLAPQRRTHRLRPRRGGMIVACHAGRGARGPRASALRVVPRRAAAAPQTASGAGGADRRRSTAQLPRAPRLGCATQSRERATTGGGPLPQPARRTTQRAPCGRKARDRGKGFGGRRSGGDEQSRAGAPWALLLRRPRRAPKRAGAAAGRREAAPPRERSQARPRAQKARHLWRDDRAAMCHWRQRGPARSSHRVRRVLSAVEPAQSRLGCRTRSTLQCC